MNVQQCYDAMHGDYAEVISRLRTDERVAKFLKRVPSDGNYEILCDAMKSGNANDALRAAHTIKGICLNLSLTALQKSSSALTEALRGKASIEADIEPLFEALKSDYETTVEAIKNLDAIQ